MRINITHPYVLKIHNYLVFIVFITGFILTEFNNNPVSIIYSFINEFLILWSLLNLYFLLNKTDVYFTSQKIEQDKLSKPGLEFIKIFFLFSAHQFILESNFENELIFFISVILSLISILFLIFHIYKNYKFGNSIQILIVGLTFFVLVIYTGNKDVYVKYYGNEIIGSYFQKPEYKTQYYVNLYRNQNTNNPYRLVADIHVHTIETGYDYDFVNDDVRTTYSKVIELERIYFPNGGYLSFEETYIQPNKINEITDQNYRVWYLELTNMNVEN